MPDTSVPVTRETLITLLNENLSREFQAVIAYVVYSQTLKGAQYMAIAKELEGHAGQELQHALTIAKQIDYLGGGEYAMAEEIREILRVEQEHQIDLATALNKNVPILPLRPSASRLKR